MKTTNYRHWYSHWETGEILQNLLAFDISPSSKQRVRIPRDCLFLENAAPARFHISVCLEQTFCTYKQHLDWLNEKSRIFAPHKKYVFSMSPATFPSIYIKISTWTHQQILCAKPLQSSYSFYAWISTQVPMKPDIFFLSWRKESMSRQTHAVNQTAVTWLVGLSELSYDLLHIFDFLHTP